MVICKTLFLGGAQRCGSSSLKATERATCTTAQCMGCFMHPPLARHGLRSRLASPFHTDFQCAPRLTGRHIKHRDKKLNMCTGLLCYGAPQHHSDQLSPYQRLGSKPALVGTGTKSQKQKISLFIGEAGTSVPSRCNAYKNFRG